jgi:hypothetical protein
MKTPRDLLLARHSGVETKLERLSERVVAGLPGYSERTADVRPCWLDWFWPRPVAWGAIAAAWIVVAAIHLATPDVEPRHVASTPFLVRSPENLAALQEQQRLFAELLDPTEPEPADRRPRSALCPEFETV